MVWKGFFLEGWGGEVNQITDCCKPQHIDLGQLSFCSRRPYLHLFTCSEFFLWIGCNDRQLAHFLVHWTWLCQGCFWSSNFNFNCALNPNFLHGNCSSAASKEPETNSPDVSLFGEESQFASSPVSGVNWTPNPGPERQTYPWILSLNLGSVGTLARRTENNSP